MKKLLIITIALSLAACTDVITKSEVDRARDLCEVNGGLKEIKIDVTNTIRCENGAEFRMSE